ncbi:MAG: ABC transporter permease [Limnochordia bacterium]
MNRGRITRKSTKKLHRTSASPMREVWQHIRASKTALFGIGIILLFGFCALIHPLLMHTVWHPRLYDPVTGYDSFSSWYALGIYDAVHPAPPSWYWTPQFLSSWRTGQISLGECLAHIARHPLGTDPIGRDILSQLMYSTRAEFILGLLTAIITVSIGTIVGTAAAYYAGWVDTFFMRLADLLMLFPGIPFLIVLSAMMDLNLVNLAIVLGILSGFGSITIIIKAQALAVKSHAYVEAARLAGGSRLWVVRKHLIPHVLPLSFLYMLFTVTAAIGTEATLSFFGLLNVGCSWGLMIHTMSASGYLASSIRYWWLWLPAGLAITLFCAAFYLIGRSLEQVVHSQRQEG